MLSKILTQEWRYPDSYFILVGAKNTIIASGKADARMADLKRSDCLVLEQPLSDSGWRLALVCPEEDIFRGYNNMIMIIVSVMVFGLLFMFAICYYIVRRTMEPVLTLTKQTTDIAEGHFDRQIAPSTRIDEVGKLQNSFHTMQKSIASHVAELETTRSETERKNKELMVAKTLAEESDHKKTVFVQDMFHQIRTPLNIVTGFAQVINDDYEMLSHEEMKMMVGQMMKNTDAITAIVNKLISLSIIQSRYKLSKEDRLTCKQLCQEAKQTLQLSHPDDVTFNIESYVPDDLYIQTNKRSLLNIISELLHNANQFTEKGCITLSCYQPDDANICFCVTDTGKGIPEQERENIFNQFFKLDEFTEGLGLGLTLCKITANQMGGDIQIDNSYNNGTRIIVTLPLN
jgi:signal transduction histidine kinase